MKLVLLHARPAPFLKFKASATNCLNQDEPMKESWKIHLDEIIIKIELHLDKFIIIVSNNDVPLNLVRMNITCSNLTLCRLFYSLREKILRRSIKKTS